MQDKQITLTFMELYLPHEIKHICNLNSLTLKSGSFVEPDLKQRFNDILYAIDTKNGKGYIYCLIEMQSKPDSMIAFRLMRYATMAMENHLKQGHKQLPLVIPLLFYCGTHSHPKSVPLNWLDHFTRPPLAKQIYTQPFTLIDISQITDDELLQHKQLGMIEYLFKHIRTRDLMQLIESINQFLMSGLYSKEQVDAVLFYVYNNSNIENPQQLADKLLQHPNHYEEQIMTFAEYLKQQGKLEGREEGVQKGQYEATLTIAKNLWENGVDIKLIQKSTGLTEVEIKQLIH